MKSHFKEQKAIDYRDRWRYIGALGGITVLVVGMCETQRWEWVNFFWLIGSGLGWGISAIIGQVIYRRKSPW
jgi:hypothetical protein